MREGRKKGLPIEAEKEEGDVKQPSFVAKKELRKEKTGRKPVSQLWERKKTCGGEIPEKFSHLTRVPFSRQKIVPRFPYVPTPIDSLGHFSLG